MSKKRNIFQENMEKHLVEFKETRQFLPSINTKKKWNYHDIMDNLYPPIRHGFLQHVYDNAVPLHDYVNHVRSSQVFAINIFYPILTKEPDLLIDVLSNISKIKMKDIESFAFEYSPEEDLLGEWRSSNKPEDYVTATDLAVFTKDYDGNSYVFLIEVKFTEDSFTECGGFNSGGNKNRDCCSDRKLLFKNYNRCYLQIKSRGKSARTYFNQFGDLNSSFPGGPELEECPFQKNHQCLRNHAFARALNNQSKIKKAFFGLVYHDDNEKIEQEWDRYFNLLSSDLKTDLFMLRTSDIVSKSIDETLKRYFKERYKI